MRLPAFTHDFLLLFAGPLVWAIHFIAIYGLHGVACARPAAAGSAGAAAVAWTLAALGLASLVLLGLWLRRAPRSETEESRRFVRWTSRALGATAALAIAWETLALVFVAACPVGA